MHFPLLPFKDVTIHLEGHAFRLKDMQRLHRFTLLEARVLLLQVREEVKAFCRHWHTLAVRCLEGIVLDIWWLSRRDG
jgi:hypothetical protein